MIKIRDKKMTRPLRHSLSIGLGICMAALQSPVTARAVEPWLTPTEMTSVFAGHAIAGAYVGGLKFNETYKPDGSISYADESTSAAGRWHISGQGFCTFYETMTGGCFLVRKFGANCFEFYVIENQERGPIDNPRNPPLVAQGWYPDRPSTCAALAV
jgi:hypothetical protein